MNTLRVTSLAWALLLLGPFFGSQGAFEARAAATMTADGSVLSGELVVINAAHNRFRLVGHSGSYIAPAGTPIEELDGKPVQVEISHSGHVLQISEMPIHYEPITHGFEVVRGQLQVTDALTRTFAIAGDDRMYVAPPGVDIQPYLGRMVELRLDERGHVTHIDLAAPSVGVPVTSTCSYNEQRYSEGASLCQSGAQYRCDRGTWRSLGLACGSDKATTFLPARTCLFGGASMANGSSICRRGSTLRCVDGEWVNVGTECS
jgi:hypothetical protein